jgi:outer membrane lipoprotein LolB
VRIAADPPNSQAQSFAAGFELSGNAQAGELTLLTPLGTTAAALSWSAQAAVLRSNGEVRYFESLDALIKQALGSEIPVAALFAWLAGENIEVAGWRADLSLHANGRIVARRMNPAPPTELLVLLD